jgi:hypothetical protein
MLAWAFALAPKRRFPKTDCARFHHAIEMLARLLPLLFALAVLLIVVIARQLALRPRNDRTYRPRTDHWGGLGRGETSRPHQQRASADADWVATRAELAGVRDAYSSAALDPDQPLYRCGGCQAFYHQTSLRALRADNLGRCVLCGSHDLCPVRVL